MCSNFDKSFTRKRGYATKSHDAGVNVLNVFENGYVLLLAETNNFNGERFVSGDVCEADQQIENH